MDYEFLLLEFQQPSGADGRLVLMDDSERAGGGFGVEIGNPPPKLRGLSKEGEGL